MASRHSDPPVGPGRSALQRRTVAVLSLAQLLGAVGSGIVLTDASLATVQLTGNRSLVGLPVTALSIVTAVAAQPLAALALRRGRRVALTCGLLVAALGSVLMLLAPVWGGFVLLVGGAGLVGLSLVVQLQARFAAADLAAPATRGRDLSLVMWAVTPGAVAGPLLLAPSSALAGMLGLPALSGPYLIATLGLLGAVLVLFLGLRPDPLLTARGLTAVAGALVAAPARAPFGSQPRAAGRPLAIGLAALRGSPAAATAAGTIAAAHLVMVGVMTGTPVHLQMMAREAAGGAASLSVVGVILSVHLGGMYALSPVMGWLSDRAGRPPVMLGALGLMVIGLLTAGFGLGSETAVAIGLLCVGLAWSAALISSSASLAENVPGDVRVPAQGVSDSLMGVAAAVGSAAAGPALAAFGFTTLNLAALVVVGAALWWCFRPAARPGGRPR